MRLRLAGFAAALTVAAFSAAEAKVEMPRIFGDNMVLQQQAALPVWGTGLPGEPISIRLGDNLPVETVSGMDGKWMAKLSPQKASAKPVTMTVTGIDSQIVFSNVIVGNVWLASGQSNMQWLLKSTNFAQKNLKTADYPDIRFFMVGQIPAIAPQDNCEGQWLVCKPETIRFFSAVGYYFAREMYQTTGEPVGMIGSYWGGTNANSWISLEVLEKKFPQYAKARENEIAEIPAYDKLYREKLLAEYRQKMTEWQEKHQANFKELMTPYQKYAAEAREEGRIPGPAPAVVRAPATPRKPGLITPFCPAGLFDGMINPLIPYAIRGVIWYQGESNEDAPGEYAALMESLIADWRARWNQGDFPFYFVQLANFRAPKPDVRYSGWALIREAQTQNLAIPNTAMTVTIDVGEVADIHPRDKITVGKRLALLEKKRLGMNVIARGPVFDKMSAHDGQIDVTFSHAGKLKTKDGSIRVFGFALAGEDRKFHWAEAELIGSKTVKVYSDKVKNPVAVRYAWADNPATNLYNEGDLPAEPFRSDDWPEVKNAANTERK